MGSGSRRWGVGVAALTIAAVLGYVAVFGDPGAEIRDGEVSATATIVSLQPVAQFGASNGRNLELGLEFIEPANGSTVRVLHRERFDGVTSVGDRRTVAFEAPDPAGARVLNDAQPPLVSAALAAVALGVALASFAGVDFIGLGVLRRR